jgi:hypothetical protein
MVVGMRTLRRHRVSVMSTCCSVNASGGGHSQECPNWEGWAKERETKLYEEAKAAPWKGHSKHSVARRQRAYAKLKRRKAK